LPGTSARFEVRDWKKSGRLPGWLVQPEGKLSAVKLGFLPGKLARGAVAFSARWSHFKTFAPAGQAGEGTEQKKLASCVKKIRISTKFLTPQAKARRIVATSQL
jgi:hypothetical protein